MNAAFQSRYDGMTAEEITNSLGTAIAAALRARYGPTPDPAIIKRVQEEWAAMEAGGGVEDIAALYELTLWLKARREPYWLRAAAGSSLILYLLGVTAGNPLPPHYYCPQCHSVVWRPDCADGFDLPPDRACETDGARLHGDGHNIPWQALWGYGKEVTCRIDAAEPLAEELWAFFQNHWLTGLRPEVKALHPYPDSNSQLIQFSHIGIFCGLDREESDTHFYDITPDTFCISKAAQILATDFGAEDGADAALRSYPVHTFADALAKFGLLHSTGVWDEDARFLVERLGYSLSDLIVYRDDVFSYLLSHGFSEKDAWSGMDRVRTGRGLPVITSEMERARDKWVLNRCEKVSYLFPKAHAVEYLLYRLRKTAPLTSFANKPQAED